jgi:hypothetical protein
MAADISTLPRIIDSRHPSFLSNFMDWEKWRLTYQGGEDFRDKYLKQFTLREDADDFTDRRDMTPIPGFAKSAINHIRNAIFQRLGDVLRKGGTGSYQKAIAGEEMGVDLRGSTMNYFLGNKCLTDLLVMGKVGVYVDMPEVSGQATLASTTGKRPYLYPYQIEDILNFSASRPEDPSEFQSVLLRDTCLNYDQRTFLPTEYTHRYRLVFIDQNTGRVNVQFMDLDGNDIDKDGNPGGPIPLDITRIPFVLLDIGDSLIKDVAQHQIALLNLGSSDVAYALKSNFPIYTEMKSRTGAGGHLKPASADGTATQGGQAGTDKTIEVGPTRGRYYDKDTERPGFIAPPSEPLKASMMLQEKLEQDIRKLVNLAVQGLASRASAESKSMDNEGLEAGLSFIGLVLEGAERRIADFWSTYEEKSATKRAVTTVSYPDRYELKSEGTRIDEATKLSDLLTSVPSRKAKKEIAKNIVTTLFRGKAPVETIEVIHKEIDAAKYTTSDLDTIIKAKEAGVVGDQTASIALGFDDDEYLQGQKDRSRSLPRSPRLKALAKLRPRWRSAARGVPELSANPSAGR